MLTQLYPGGDQGQPGEAVTTTYGVWGEPYALQGDSSYVSATYLNAAVDSV